MSDLQLESASRPILPAEPRGRSTVRWASTGATVLVVVLAGALVNGLRVPLEGGGLDIGPAQFLALLGAGYLILRWGLRDETSGVLLVLIVTVALMAYLAFFQVDTGASLNRAGALVLRLVTLLGVLVGMRRLEPAGRIRVLVFVGSCVLAVALATQLLGLGTVARAGGTFAVAASANGATSTAGELLVGQGVGLLPGSEASFVAGLVVIFALALLISPARRSPRGADGALAIVGLLLAAAVVVLGGTRIVPVALAVALLLGLVHQFGNRQSVVRQARWIAVLLLCAVISGGLIAAGIFLTSSQLVARWDRPASSLGLRADIWSGAVKATLERPIEGWGSGSVPYRLSRSGPGVIGNVPNAHDDLLTWAAEWGVIVAAVYGGLLVLAVIKSWRLRDWWYFAFVVYFCVCSTFWPTLSNLYSADAFLFATGFVSIAAAVLPAREPEGVFVPGQPVRQSAR